MPPPLLPSSPAYSRNQRPLPAARRPLSAASTRNGTPKGTVAVRAIPKTRDSGEKENEPAKVDRKQLARRQTSASILNREPLPSKDGSAQMDAKEVEGLKDFQLGNCVGRGAFGSVYRALNWSTGETVAIKQVRLADLPKAELKVIMQEIDLLKNLNHPNIVKYHGFVKSKESLYIILEYCENGSLHSICKNFGKFPENLVSLYTAQVLQGLLFLHEQGVIHRDIKGANILTTKEGLVKLADFGVATKQSGLSEGSVVGTPYWMAPEVIELSGASTASDIWSLGCTVIELLDGKPPYHKFAPMPALFRIVNDDHPPLPEGVSPLVRDFLMQCFQKDPNLRVTAKKLLKHPWIMSTKKGEKKKAPEHTEAVKSVKEWNQALKASPPPNGMGSRRSSTRPGSRPISRSDANGSRTLRGTPTAAGGRSAHSHGLRKAQSAAFASPPDDSKRDKWDDDFESLSTELSSLQIPDRLRPQDNFAGLFSSEKLKQYASSDGFAEAGGKVEEWDEEFEGDLTVRSPLHLDDGNAVDTVRTFYPPQTTSSEIKHQAPFVLGTHKRREPREQYERRGSKDSQPRTQILLPAQKSTAASKAKQMPAIISKKLTPPTAANRDRYREDDEEDYSDLVAEDEAAFMAKLADFSPNRPVQPSELRNIQSKLSTTSRRRTQTPTNLVHDAAAMRRTRSSLEIQKYREDAADEDFTDLCFDGEGELPMNLQPKKTRSPQSATTSSDSAGSDHGTLKLSKSSSWLGDEEDEDDDPFAALEEELDAVDLQSNVARDKHARLCTLVESLVSDLKLSQPEDVLGEIVEQLLQILSESPDVKTVIVSSHGMLPILEIMDTCPRPYTVLRLLQIVNCIISDNVEVQENLCFVGGIPIISRFAHKKYSSDIRLEAAAFVRMMYQTSTLTLQMFVSCGGLNVLVEFLEEDYDTDFGRELVLTGVNGVSSVFELQGPTPKNDFCRIFSRSSVLYPLSLVLNHVLGDDRDSDDPIEGRIVNIFLLFSQAENHVKETVADRMVLKHVLKDLRRMSPQHQITMLKFIKNLSMLATTLDALQNSNAIEVLTDLLNASMHTSHFREISNQILNTMYNLCRLSKARQEDAALSGVVPLLQRIVQTERPLKEFALPILCDMAHSGKVGRKVLWQNKGLHFYIGLLADQYWAVTALDAIFIWLQEETAKVEEHLLASTAFSDAVVQCFNESKADAFENLLEPLQKLLRLSPPVAASLARRSLFERSAVKVHAKKPLVRLNLLRVIRSICDASGEDLLRQYGLFDSVRLLAQQDAAILVREMANDLVKATHHGLSRRTSSSVMITPTNGSMPPTPSERGSSRASGYFDFGLELSSRARPPAATNSPYRPTSRDGSTHSISSSKWSSATSTSATRRESTRPPSRTSLAIPRAGSRLSMAPASNGSTRLPATVVERSTPTHAPPSANTRAAAVNARRRRQTSGAELSR